MIKRYDKQWRQETLWGDVYDYQELLRKKSNNPDLIYDFKLSFSIIKHFFKYGDKYLWGMTDFEYDAKQQDLDHKLVQQRKFFKNGWICDCIGENGEVLCREKKVENGWFRGYIDFCKVDSTGKVIEFIEQKDRSNYKLDKDFVLQALVYEHITGCTNWKIMVNNRKENYKFKVFYKKDIDSKVMSEQQDKLNFIVENKQLILDVLSGKIEVE